MSDEVRPFFGDESEAISAPEWRNTNDKLRRGSPADRYEWRIREGMCPGSAGACGGTLDESLFCDRCGQTWEPLTHAPLEPDFLPTLPGALFIDEYAEANVEDIEAA